MYPFSIFTLFSKSIFPANYIFLNLYNLVSKCAVFTPSKSQPKKTEDLSERCAKEKIKIIQNVIIQPSSSQINLPLEESFPVFNKCNGRLCFICTFTIHSSKKGIKCKYCVRTFHVECILKKNLSTFSGLPDFCCSSCLLRNSSLQSV